MWPQPFAFCVFVSVCMETLLACTIVSVRCQHANFYLCPFCLSHLAHWVWGWERMRMGACTLSMFCSFYSLLEIVNVAEKMLSYCIFPTAAIDFGTSPVAIIKKAAAPPQCTRWSQRTCSTFIVAGIENHFMWTSTLRTMMRRIELTIYDAKCWHAQNSIDNKMCWAHFCFE